MAKSTTRRIEANDPDAILFLQNMQDATSLLARVERRFESGEDLEIDFIEENGRIISEAVRVIQSFVELESEEANIEAYHQIRLLMYQANQAFNKILAILDGEDVQFTPTERELLPLIVEGLEAKAMAERLGTKLSSVKGHLARIRERICASTMPALVLKVLRGGYVKGSAPDSLESNPSDRELEVLRKLADGLTAKEIGAALGISDSTVDIHLGTLYRKFAVNKSTALVARAFVHGFIR